MQAHGMDVSQFQGAVDWKRARRSGIVFAFVKATQGSQTIDSSFRQHWQAMREAEILRGAYHFYLVDKEPVEQARHFIQTVGSLETNDLPPVLDLEDRQGIQKHGLSGPALAKDIQLWLRIVGDAFAVTPMIYTDPVFWNQYMTDAFGKFPLWVTHPHVLTPLLPAGWDRYRFWQYENRGCVSGMGRDVPVNLNRFDGNYDDLLEFVSMGAAPKARTPD